MQRAANDLVVAENAQRLERDTGIDWPVSGDETRRGYGYIGMRRVAQSINIWDTANLTGVSSDTMVD
jgi:hypothetical protein